VAQEALLLTVRMWMTGVASQLPAQAAIAVDIACGGD
jgi:hypothetical protein